jgi:hypothetical protein
LLWRVSFCCKRIHIVAVTAHTCTPVNRKWLAAPSFQKITAVLEFTKISID